MKNPELNFVIPLYNEAAVFDTLINRLNTLMETSEVAIQVILVDDGSTDNTAALLQDLANLDKRYTVIILSRNFGHQIALTAGLDHVTATKAVMILDGDLQDPPEMYVPFLQHIEEGFDVVYGVREKREAVWWKKLAYKTFYKLQSRLTHIPIPVDTGDFCMISRKVVELLKSMPEESRFIRGMRSWIGLNQKGIGYERPERAAGVTKYSIRKLLQLAFNGIFNFSELPVRLLTWTGILTIMLTGIYLGWILFEKFYMGTSPRGFTATIAIITLFGGVQLMGLGLLGEYILRIFFQTKGRPLYVIKNVIGESA